MEEDTPRHGGAILLRLSGGHMFCIAATDLNENSDLMAAATRLFCGRARGTVLFITDYDEMENDNNQCVCTHFTQTTDR